MELNMQKEWQKSLMKKELKMRYIVVTAISLYKSGKYTKAFEKGEIEIMCVKDIFNEGIDIKQIDCLLILRPTDSSTIAIQQLGEV